MKRSWAVLFFCLPLFFFAESLSARSALEVNYPRISNPNFSISGSTVKVSFDYSGLAGSIQDARIYLVVSLLVTPRMDRLEVFPHIIGGWKGFF